MARLKDQYEIELYERQIANREWVNLAVIFEPLYGTETVSVHNVQGHLVDMTQHVVEGVNILEVYEVMTDEQGNEMFIRDITDEEYKNTYPDIEDKCIEFLEDI